MRVSDVLKYLLYESWCYMVVYGAILWYMLLFGGIWCFVVLYGDIWCYVVLYGGTKTFILFGKVPTLQ